MALVENQSAWLKWRKRERDRKKRVGKTEKWREED